MEMSFFGGGKGGGGGGLGLQKTFRRKPCFILYTVAHTVQFENKDTLCYDYLYVSRTFKQISNFRAIKCFNHRPFSFRFPTLSIELIVLMCVLRIFEIVSFSFHCEPSSVRADHAAGVTHNCLRAPWDCCQC